MIKTIQSQIIAIPRKDIDTDLIIPAEFLTGTVREGLGQHLFTRVRQSEKDFELLEKHPDSEILVVRDNFGCGSSREHAAWSLYDFGIRVIIAPSFADIFFNNAMKNGILPIILSEETVEKILSESGASEKYEITVDLPSQKVTLPDNSEYEFSIDPYRKTCLMEGMDDLDYLISNKNEIEGFDNNKSNLFFDISKL